MDDRLNLTVIVRGSVTEYLAKVFPSPLAPPLMYVCACVCVCCTYACVYRQVCVCKSIDIQYIIDQIYDTRHSRIDAIFK